MKIVMDTSVVLAAFFFGGPSREIVERVARGKLAAYATREIVKEYRAAVETMESQTGGGLRPDLLLPFIARLHIIEPKSTGAICKSPGDDKFLFCAIDARAVYIVKNDRTISFKKGQHRFVKSMTAEGLGQLLSLL